MAIKIRPLHDRVVVEPAEREEKTESGLFLPESAKEKPQQGIVVAVGPGKRDEDGEYITPDVAEGDRILFAKYAGTEIKLNGKDVLILKETDILGVVEE